jgi:hypothetical protein
MKKYIALFGPKKFLELIYSIFSVGLRVQKHGPGPDTNPNSPEA